jgi:hypothetical protein
MTFVPEANYLTAFNQTPLATTTPLQLAAAPGAGYKLYLTDIHVTNASSSTGTVVQLLSASTVVWMDYFGPTQKGPPAALAIPVACGANEALSLKCLTAGASVYAFVNGFKAKGVGASTGSAPVTPPSAPSYDPANYFTGATIGFNYLFDTPGADLLNGSGTAAGDGQTVATVKSQSGVTADATQSTDANRPVLRTNAINTTMSVVELDGGDTLNVTAVNAFLNNASSATVGLVWRPTDFVANHNFFEMDDATSYNPRLQCRLSGAQVALDYNPDTAANGNDVYSGGSNLLSAGVDAAVLYQVDAAAKTVAIYANNATFKAPTVVTGPMQNWGTGGGVDSRLFRNAKGRCAHLFLAKNALMSSTQRANWFADVKTRYGLTAY